MSFDVNSLKIDTLLISNTTNNLTFDSGSDKLRFISNYPIEAGQKTINMGGNTLTNIQTLKGTDDEDYQIEAKGSSSLNINVVSGTDTTEMNIDNSGLITFNHLPNCSSGLTSNPNELLCARNFNSSDLLTFTPELLFDSGIGGITSRTYTYQSGVYFKIGNFIYFSARIVLSSYTTSNGGISPLRVKIPIPVPYTTVNIPQGIQLSSYINVKQLLSIRDLFLCIENIGFGFISNIDYGSLYYKPTLNSDPTTFLWNMLDPNFEINYGGMYYLIP